MCDGVDAPHHTMKANPTMDQMRAADLPTHQELPEVLDNYWISAHSRDFHITVRCWTSEISALGLSTALPPAQKSGDFTVHVLRCQRAE